MNRVFVLKLFILLLLAIIHPVSAQHKTSIEIRSAAFFHSSALFREIYGNPGSSYQLQAVTQLSHYLDGWALLDWFSTRGASLGLNDPTRVNIVNVGLGIQFPFQLSDRFIPYVGIGTSFSTIWIKNKSPCNDETVSKVAVGGILKTGVYYFVNSRFFIDVFADYLCQPVNFETHVDIGGFKVGAGIGIKF